MPSGEGDGALLGRAPTSHDMSTEPPPLAAAFLIQFDMRKGYSIIWQRSLQDSQLEGVEYKSLPSGLHNVEEDLIYFIYNDHAGLSAFLHRALGESRRNVLMLAVGVLVPLSYGRLGKSWRHAQSLKDLARQIADDPNRLDVLEDYWEKYKIGQDFTGLDGAQDSPLSFKDLSESQKQSDTSSRKRGTSDATAILRQSHALATYHPALSLPDLVITFGPLIFPLYKSALLRKRILILGEVPVQSTCDYVYGLSILASLPQSLTRLLPYDHSSQLTLRPLFNVGIHDIPYLADIAKDPGSSWIACTTDGVLAMKPTLFDILVRLPSASSSAPPHKPHPTILPSSPSLSQYLHQQSGLKSTQRDARRYTTLRVGLNSLPSSRPSEDAATDSDAASSVSSTFSSTPSTYSNCSIVEPVSWSQLTYTSFMWWASAGENAIASEQEVENEQDSGLLLVDLQADDNRPDGKDVYRVPNQIISKASGITKEMALVSYFHRLTTLIFTTLAEIVAREDADTGPEQCSEPQRQSTNQPSSSTESQSNVTDTSPNSSDTDSASISDSNASDDEQARLLPNANHGDEDSPPLGIITILPEDLTRMGLDVWSASDRAFVEELVGVWWGRKGRVRGGEVRCCGVRVL